MVRENGGIQLAIERLQKKFQPNDIDDIKQFNHYIETVQRQVDDIGKLVEEFGSFARMPSANLILTDLNSVILTQYSLFKESKIDIRWSCSINKTLNNYILIDPQLIRQALTNLIQNAVDVIEENIKVGLGEIVLHTEDKDNIISLIIEDNGTGFPEDIENLTNPYVTLREKGTGLGLSIVKRIMEEHNGKLILSDSKSGGAKVTLEFPKV